MAHTTSDGPTGHRAGAALPASSAPVVILLGMAGGAWLITARLATADMRLGVLTGASPMSMSGGMGAAGPMSMSLGTFIGIWTVMMVAMMAPSVVPAVKGLDAQARAADRPRGAPLLFVVGYLLVWSATGGAAYVIVQAIQAWLPMGNPAAIRAGALLLIVAGVYQLTPLKLACLRHCQRSGKEMAPREIAPVQGSLGSLRIGLVHGVYCLGSSWPLMLVLLLLGMMNLAWMAAVAAVIFIEKVVPGGDVVGKVVGWVLVGAGIILIAAPHPLPALMSLSTWLQPS
ncbi:MAG TPA: DUF2182 domain-containing protein [Ktedonobacterales bacterium]|nr:DUF2182 domain-containing protein [Ktedonobacterales bacterium]